MDTIRIAERLSQDGVFSEQQAKRLATLADHAKDELATKQDLAVLRAELKADMASFRNQLLGAQAAAFIGILLYITFKL